MAKPITDRMLKEVSIEQNDIGFVVWIVESNGDRHWLVDGSTVLETGVIYLPSSQMRKIYRHSVKVDRGEIMIVRKK